MLESNSIVAGGGSVEVALSVYLDEYARTLGSREQLAIAEFSEFPLDHAATARNLNSAPNSSIGDTLGSENETLRDSSLFKT